MSLTTRQKVLLAVFGALSLVLLVVETGDGRRGPAPSGPSLAERTARLRASAAEAPLVTEVVMVRSDLLDPFGERFEIGRDPFRFGEVERPAPPPVREPPPKPVEPPPKPKPEPPPVVVDQGPRPPSTGHLRYLGSFGREGRKIAVITSGEEIFNVLEGGIVEEVFVVEEIGYESLALGYVDFPDEPSARLPVGG